MSRWRLALYVVAGVAYAGASHWMMLFHADAPWAVAVLLGPLWLTALGLGASRFGATGFVLAAAAGIAVFALVLHGDAGDPNRLYVLQHLGINVLLCGWFGLSLRGDRLSLIGEFARRVHPLSPAMRVYTRQVTWVWTIYFALIVLASAAAYLTLPFAAWALLANVLGPLLVAVLFVGEYLLRYRLHPEFERTGLIDAIRAFSGVPVDGATRR